MIQIVENSEIPIIVNGDIQQSKDVKEWIDKTGAKGVMSARGILSNPGIFKNVESGTIEHLECAQKYLAYALKYGGHFTIHHHHLMYILNPSHLTRPEKRDFNTLKSMCGIIDFFETRNWMSNVTPFLN